MSLSAIVLEESPVRLWGLSSRQRLRRQLREAGGVQWLDSLDRLAESGRVLLLNGNYLFEVRTLAGLLEREQSVLRCAADSRVAAAICHAGDAPSLAEVVSGRSDRIPEGVGDLVPGDFAAFDDTLRRSQAPLLEPVREDNRLSLENRLYGNAYRGITDLVTKFFWPKPAKRAVRMAARLGLTPNQVTATGFVLVLAACYLFLAGQYAAGLAAGWLMTFLDTVDGKLARVTVQSSRFGHLFDHGIDLLHPPFWYICWGASLQAFEPVLGLDRVDFYGVIVGGYVLGRAVEGVFPLLGECGVFTWRPFDAWFRLVTARRNPCMILLTFSVLVGRPDWGFLAVAFWTAATSAVLVIRLIQGGVARLRHGRLQSWLSDPSVATGPNAGSYRVFGRTRSAYGEG